MIFPDCRLDETYNEDYLNENDKGFIDGFDYCLEQIKNLFENNLDVYEGRLEVDTEVDVDKFLDKAKDELSEMCADWLEMQRNEMITSMIDSMDDEEYEKLKSDAKMLNESLITPKKYCDTRKW